jgi:hypothetical protein
LMRAALTDDQRKQLGENPRVERILTSHEYYVEFVEPLNTSRMVA